MTGGATGPRPLPGLLDIAPYVGGESEIEGVDRVIKLASNEGAFGPSPKAMQALKDTAGGIYRYPDGDSQKLRAALAAKHGIDMERIVVGAGSDDLITLLCRSYAGVGDEVLFTAHAFAMYPIYARGVRATLVAAPEDGITADVDNLLERAGKDTKLLFIANPNNPTGTYLPAGEIKRLRAGLPDHVLLVLDAAYCEYVSRNDYEPGINLVDGSDNILMLRTFSKIYGLGGLRIGWCYGPEMVVDVLNRLRSPFNVSNSGQAAALAALGDDEFVEMSRRHNDACREWTTGALRQIGITVPDSVCNFVLARFAEEPGRNAEAADAFLRAKGVIVRRMGGYGLPDSLRISIGTDEEMKLVVGILTEFMGA